MEVIWLFYISLALGIVFFIISIMFLIFKQKAWPLVYKYNKMSKYEKKHYDINKITICYSLIFIKSSFIAFFSGIFCFYGSINLYFIFLFLSIFYLIFHIVFNYETLGRYRL